MDPREYYDRLQTAHAENGTLRFLCGRTTITRMQLEAMPLAHFDGSLLGCIDEFSNFAFSSELGGSCWEKELKEKGLRTKNKKKKIE